MVEAAYMLSSVFFILSLNGLSHPSSSKKGNIYGIFGMTIAIFATFFTSDVDSTMIIKFFVASVIGAIIGVTLALRIDMINVPQLVAVLHSFVGVAATIVGYGSFFQNNYRGVDPGAAHNVELFIGVFIGTITFVGSVVAFGKVQDLINSKPLILLGSFRHIINLALVLGSIVLCILFIYRPFSILCLVIMTVLALILGWHLVISSTLNF